MTYEEFKAYNLKTNSKLKEAFTKNSNYKYNP